MKKTEYLKNLLVASFTLTPTPQKSLEDLVLEKALAYGRSLDEAKEDMRIVLNLESDVLLLLDEISSKTDEGI